MNQKLKSQETQSIILESAFNLFYEKGYRATSIEAIVKHSGLSKGAFYHHFKNKKDVGEQTINFTLRKKIYDAVINPLKFHGSKPIVNLLIDLFTNRITNFSVIENKLGCPLNNLINELGCSEETFRLSLRKIIEEWKTTLIDLLEYGKKNGEIRNDVDTQTTAIYIISSFEGARGIGKLYNNNEILMQYLSGFVTYVEQLK